MSSKVVTTRSAPASAQLLLVAETRHADRRHAASLGCLHATRRILDDETHLR